MAGENKEVSGAGRLLDGDLAATITTPQVGETQVFGEIITMPVGIQAEAVPATTAARRKRVGLTQTIETTTDRVVKATAITGPAETAGAGEVTIMAVMVRTMTMIPG